MRITNNAGLPAPFVRMAQSDYKPSEKQYSATTLLKPVREILLKRRYDSDLEQDCSDMIWALFGTAVHSVLEKYGGMDETEIAEQLLKVKLENGYTVSGKVDFYDKTKRLIVDYKTASVWKVQFKDFSDWKQQGMIYAWLLIKNGLPVEAVEFFALLKDHSPRKAAFDPDYPKQAVYKVHYDVTDEDLLSTDKFIRAKIDEIIKYENTPDNELPLCPPKDRWNEGDKYAVMSKGKKRALRVLDTEEQAEQWKNKNGGDYIEIRKGEDKKCLNYCLCCRKCNYWKELRGD